MNFKWVVHIYAEAYTGSVSKGPALGLGGYYVDFMFTVRLSYF